MFFKVCVRKTNTFVFKTQQKSIVIEFYQWNDSLPRRSLYCDPLPSPTPSLLDPPLPPYPL